MIHALTAPITCAVSDRRRLAPEARTWGEARRALVAWCAEVIEAGVTLLQLRERDLDGGALAAIAREVVALAPAGGTRVLINDRADVARAVGADGVHLRSAGLPTARVRPYGGAAWTIGRSVHTLDEVRRERQPDYLIFGTTFATPSKAGAAVQGETALADAAGAAVVPVLAIGGVSVDRLASVAAAGAAGIAAVGLFLPPGADPAALGPRRAVAAVAEAFAGVTARTARESRARSGAAGAPGAHVQGVRGAMPPDRF